MALSLQECIDKVKEKQPSLYPVWYIEDQGKYLFNLLKRWVSKDEATSNFYAVDPDDGTVAGPIPVMSIYDNDDLAEKLEHPHMISGQDQRKLVHSLPDTGYGWAIKKNADFLAHHGIKGQKWGIRRYQDENGILTEEGRRHYGYTDTGTGGLKQRFRENKAEKADKVRRFVEKEADIDREKTKKGGMDSSVAIDIAYTVMNPINVLSLAKKGAGAAVASHKLKGYMKNRESKSDPDPETGLRKKKEGAYDEKQDLAAVNPGFMDLNSNTKNNCMLCTTTYDLRKRGYDVTAQLDSQGYTFPDLKRWYPDAKIEHNDRRDTFGRALGQKDYMEKTKRNLLKQGDGAHGNMMVFFKNGGGHSIFYEIQNGQLIFKDGQSNKVYTNPDKILKATLTNSYARLDNVEPDMKRIKAECVR